MPTINNLTATDTVTDGDLIPLFVQAAGDARKVSASTLKAYMNSGATTADDKVTQYAQPSATGFSIQVNDAGESVWLVIIPAAGYAAGTLVMPALANCTDKQELLVNCTQAVTALTVSGNGATVTGAPTTLAANAFFTLRFDGVLNVWYRVG